MKNGEERKNETLMPRFKARLGKEERLVLADTGAGLNFIKTDSLPGEAELRADMTRVIQACGEVSKPVRGKVTLDIDIQGVRTTEDFIVLDNLNEEVILGTPWFTRNKVLIDCVRHCMYFGLSERAVVYFETAKTVPKTTREHRLVLPPLPVPLRGDYLRLLCDFRDVFREDREQTTQAAEYHIRPKNPTPFRQQPYSQSTEKKGHTWNQTEQMLGQTIGEATQLPVIQETLRELGTAKVFSTLDLKAGKYTAFATTDCALQEIITLVHPFTKVYLDNVIIFSNPHEEHVHHLRMVLKQIQAHGLRCALFKCHFGREINCLGYWGRAETDTPQEKHLAQLRDFPSPRTKRELQTFLGLFNLLRVFVKDAAFALAPLTDMIFVGPKFKWTPECEEVFADVKRRLAQPLRLYRPQPGLRYYVQVDATKCGMRAALYQKDEAGNKRVISYSSARFGKTEQKYDPNEQKCLAVIWAIRRYRPYLEEAPFTLVTDSCTLLWLGRMRDQKENLTRWSLLLQEFKFEVEHSSGKNNEPADGNNLEDFYPL